MTLSLYNLLVKSIDLWQNHSGLSNLKTHTIYSKILDSDSLVIDSRANCGQFCEAIIRELNSRFTPYKQFLLCIISSHKMVYLKSLIMLYLTEMSH